MSELNVGSDYFAGSLLRFSLSAGEMRRKGERFKMLAPISRDVGQSLGERELQARYRQLLIFSE